MKSKYEVIGNHLTMGAVNYLLKVFVIAYIFCLIVGYLRPIDDSDSSRWSRSGFKIHTDAKTGVQYISTPSGGIAPRIDHNGNIIIAR